MLRLDGRLSVVATGLVVSIDGTGLIVRMLGVNGSLFLCATGLVSVDATELVVKWLKVDGDLSVSATGLVSVCVACISSVDGHLLLARSLS
jgi:hypothetical protein